MTEFIAYISFNGGKKEFLENITEQALKTYRTEECYEMMLRKYYSDKMPSNVIYKITVEIKEI